MAVLINQVSKAYNGKPVLKKVDKVLKDGGIYCLMGLSGSGKTTLLHILMGLVKPDSGFVQGKELERIGAVFQEDRLFLNLTAVKNIQIVCSKRLKEEEIRNQMERILPKECQDQLVHELSGGMKRRLAVLRAVLSDSSILLMDEPFTGLDKESKRKVIRYILEEKSERLLVVSTHQQEDVKLLKGQIFSMGE